MGAPLLLSPPLGPGCLVADTSRASPSTSHQGAAPTVTEPSRPGGVKEPSWGPGRHPANCACAEQRFLWAFGVAGQGPRLAAGGVDAKGELIVDRPALLLRARLDEGPVEKVAVIGDKHSRPDLFHVIEPLRSGRGTGRGSRPSRRQRLVPRAHAAQRLSVRSGLRSPVLPNPPSRTFRSRERSSRSLNTLNGPLYSAVKFRDYNYCQRTEPKAIFRPTDIYSRARP